MGSDVLMHLCTSDSSQDEGGEQRHFGSRVRRQSVHRVDSHWLLPE